MNTGKTNGMLQRILLSFMIIAQSSMAHARGLGDIPYIVCETQNTGLLRLGIDLRAQRIELSTPGGHVPVYATYWTEKRNLQNRGSWFRRRQILDITAEIINTRTDVAPNVARTVDYWPQIVFRAMLPSSNSGNPFQALAILYGPASATDPVQTDVLSCRFQ